MTRHVRAAGPRLSMGPSEDSSNRGYAVLSWKPPGPGKICRLNQGAGAGGRRAAGLECSRVHSLGFGCRTQMSPAEPGFSGQRAQGNPLRRLPARGVLSTKAVSPDQITEMSGRTTNPALPLCRQEMVAQTGAVPCLRRQSDIRAKNQTWRE